MTPQFAMGFVTGVIVFFGLWTLYMAIKTKPENHQPQPCPEPRQHTYGFKIILQDCLDKKRIGELGQLTRGGEYHGTNGKWVRTEMNRIIYEHLVENPDDILRVTFTDNNIIQWYAFYTKRDGPLEVVEINESINVSK